MATEWKGETKWVAKWGSLARLQMSVGYHELLGQQEVVVMALSPTMDGHWSASVDYVLELLADPAGPEYRGLLEGSFLARAPEIATDRTVDGPGSVREVRAHIHVRGAGTASAVCPDKELVVALRKATAGALALDPARQSAYYSVPCAPCAHCGEDVPIGALGCLECGEDAGDEEMACEHCDGKGSYGWEGRGHYPALTPPSGTARCEKCDGTGKVETPFAAQRAAAIIAAEPAAEGTHG